MVESWIRYSMSTNHVHHDFINFGNLIHTLSKSLLKIVTTETIKEKKKKKNFPRWKVGTFDN